MQVQGNIVKLSIVFLILFFSSLAFAGTFDDIKELYQKEKYRESLKLISNEIKQGNKDPELYKLQAMNYEALFDVEASIEAYKMYEALKSNRLPEPTPTPTIKPTPIVLPSFLIIKFPSSKPTPTPTIVTSILPSNKPSLKPTPKPTPKVVKTPKATLTPEISLQPVYKGWQYFEVLSYKITKNIKIIKDNSIDLVENIEKAPIGYNFIVVNTKIRYGINIVIKTNSQQIAIIDANNIKHPMFAMSTYKFQYEGNKQYKKSEAIQVADYYQISKKDSRNTITFVFKVKDNLKFKSIKIMGYDKIIPLKNLIR